MLVALAARPTLSTSLSPVQTADCGRPRPRARAWLRATGAHAADAIRASTTRTERKRRTDGPGHSGGRVVAFGRFRVDLLQVEDRITANRWQSSTLKEQGLLIG